MSDNAIIKVSHVSKQFKLPHEKNSSIKGIVVGFYKRKKGYELQKALNDVSFEIKKGEFFGIVGRNGSGKSTLLKMLAGIYTPSSGGIDVQGSLTPFIELGVGFNQELTGRENVFLNGALLGFSRKEMSAMYKDIVKFAELEKFMDQKLKNYSSGMQVRLAFSIAIRAQSDILLIDEVLAVGDLAFQEKCYTFFEDVKKTGRTIVFVSHDSAAIERFCDRVIIIDQGKMVDMGEPTEMILKYGVLVAGEQFNESGMVKDGAKHHGNGFITIKEVNVIDKSGKKSPGIKAGEPFDIEVKYKLNRPIKGSVVAGVDIIDDQGISILGPNTREAKKPMTIKRSGTITASFGSNPLAPKAYSITAGIFNKEETLAYDLVENIIQFKIVGDGRHGKIYIEPSWQLNEVKV